MEGLAHRLLRIKPSPTVAMTAQVQLMKDRGCDVIGLSAGEPDFATPAHIRAAACAAIEAGKTRYTAPDGIAELKAAICRKFHRDNGLSYEPAQISVGSGGKQIIYNALMATLNPGDEVIIPAPYWVSYPDMVALARGVPVIVKTTPKAGFRITAAQLQAALTPRTRWVLLNSPANPSGAGYDWGTLESLAQLLIQHPRVWVLSDDIYEHLTYDDFRFCTIAQVAPALHARTLICNGVSKAYAMTGWRIGYGAGPAPLIAAMRSLQSQSTSNPCTISQWAALAALEGPQDCLPRHARLFQRRRDRVMALLNATGRMRCLQPKGAFYLYPCIADVIGMRTAKGRILHTDEDFTAALLEEAGVAVVAGTAFGLSPYFRISYAASDEALQTACQRIQDFCAALTR